MNLNDLEQMEAELENKRLIESAMDKAFSKPPKNYAATNEPSFSHFNQTQMTERKRKAIEKQNQRKNKKFARMIKQALGEMNQPTGDE